jgi:hypothetical protein
MVRCGRWLEWRSDRHWYSISALPSEVRSRWRDGLVVPLLGMGLLWSVRGAFTPHRPCQFVSDFLVRMVRTCLGPLPRNVSRRRRTRACHRWWVARATLILGIVRTPTFRPQGGLFRPHITHQLQEVPLWSLMSAIRARATGQGYEPGCCRRRSSAMMSFGVMSDDTSTPFSFAMRARLAEVNIGVPP